MRAAIIAMWARACRQPRIVVNPSGLVEALAPLMARHGNPDMHVDNDAQELYLILADALSEVRWPSVGEAALPSAVALALAGQTRQVVRCESCNARSVGTPEDFTTLALDLPDADASETRLAGIAGVCTDAAIEAMLETHLRPTRVADYACDACGRGEGEEGRGRSATRFCCLWRLPRLLVLTVKRFGDGGRTRGGLAVNRTEVHPSPVLRADLLAPLAAPGSPAAGILERRQGSARPPVVYRLCALVCHSGASMRAGHYVACTRRPGTNDWHVHDDGTTAPCPNPSGATGAFFRRSAYMIFYELGGEPPPCHPAPLPPSVGGT